MNFLQVAKSINLGAARQQLPEWMFDPIYCRHCRIGKNPAIDYDGLDRLYVLLMAVPACASIIQRCLDTRKQGDDHGEGHATRDSPSAETTGALRCAAQSAEPIGRRARANKTYAGSSHAPIRESGGKRGCRRRTGGRP